MSAIHDIYNPPPAPRPYEPPPPVPLRWTWGDVAALAFLAAPVALASVWAWTVEPTLGLWVSIAGAFVLLESWFSALTFLHRHPEDADSGLRRRWLIFAAALVPWLISLGFAAALMLGLFRLSDWAG